ncbi:hypothetical protein PMAYCL1PPCAC_12282, partial [Pristionchus mayeri]
SVVMTEVDLPRGGSIVEKKEKRQRDDSEEDGLFKKKAKKEDSKKGKIGLPEGHEHSGKENELDGVWKSPITHEVMIEGVLGLGYVSEIRVCEVILETASSFRVTLPITELGAYALAEVKADRLQLEDAFPIGHAVPFKVLAKEKTFKKKPLNKQPAVESSAIKVTIDPAKINKHLGPTTIFVGLAIAAEVKSIEEKGLLLDIGLKNTSAFLSKDLLPNGFTPKVGLPLTVRIQSTANMRMLQVALAVEMDTLSEEAISSLSLRSLMPGTIILASPLQTKSEGAFVSLGNGVNAWLPRRAMPPRIRSNIESFVRPLRVVILLCQQNSRLLCISAHPDIVAVSRSEKRRNFQGVHLGDVIKCEVTRRKEGKVEMAIVREDEEDDGKGSLLTVTATKASLEGAANEKRYSMGSHHEMRVLGVRIAERAITVGNTKEIMKMACVSFQDAKGGAKVSAVIKKLTTAGVHVLIFGRIRGFIPIRYMSDKGVTSVEKAFPLNESIPCRVLTSSEEHRNVLLTARKSQIADEGSLITDWSLAKPGQTCVGVVVHRFERGGSLVSFYNDIRGMLPDVECRKKKNLEVGDAINVRIVAVDEEKKRMELAIADGSLPVNVVLKAKEASVLSASSITGSVQAVNGGGKKKSGGEGIVLDVESSSITIPPSLLSDSLDSPFTSGSLDEILPSKRMVGEEMQLIPLGDQSGLHRATGKRFIMEWASKVGGMPTRGEEMESGMIVPGVVSQRVVDYGYTVEIPGGTGVVGRIAFSAINEGESGEHALSIGQTVVVRVTHVDTGKKMMSLALEWSSPSSSFNIPLELVRSSIGEQQWMGERHGLPPLGEKVTGEVVQVMDDVCLMRMEREGKRITAYARKGNFPKETLTGTVVTALCIDYVWPRGDVEVAIVEEEEKKDQKKKKTPKKEKKEIQCSPRVVLSRRDYMGVLVDGGVVYTPARCHPNHVIRGEELAAVGSSVVLRGEREEMGGVRVSEREGDEEGLERAKKEMEGSGKDAAIKKTKTVGAVEEESIGGPLVKKFGISKGRVEGLVALPKDGKKAAGERSRCAILIKMNGGVMGRLHVSELPSRFLVEGTTPLETFLSEYQHRSIHVLVMTLKHVEVEGKKSIVCDVSLNEEKLANVKKCKRTVDVRNKFHNGDLVSVFYADHGVKGQLVYEVNPRWRALVEGSSDKHAVTPDYGVMKRAKVLAINKQSMELTVVLVENMKLQPGSVCTARYHSFSLAPIKTLVTVSSGERGMLTLTSICDDFQKAVKRMKELKTSNELMDVRLLAHHAEGVSFQWVVVSKERSAKKNGVVDPLIKSRDDVKEGSTLRGFVAYMKKDEVKIELGPGVLAELVEESEKRESLKVNDLVSVKVMEVDEDGDILVDVEKIVQSNGGGERKRLSSTATDASIETPKKRVKGEKEEKKKIVKEKKELADPGFDWSSSAFSMDAMAEIGGIRGKMGDMNVESEGEEKMEVEEEETKKEKKEKKKKSEMSISELEVEKEKKLSAKERKMMEEEGELTSDGDYARALKGDPNDAQLWIRYMSHFMGKDELAKARAIAEKALTTINYREDAELFVLWCAYVNLEVSFGDVDSWNGVFTRACESADSYKMHKHMAAILAENEKFAEADAIFEKLIKKFRSKSDEVWTLYGEYLYSNGREEEARALMTRALQCVPNTRHVALIARFAALEYTKGDEEKGRNIFENLLATYPKKTEVWSTYVDLSVKHANVDQARHVLERVTSLPLSVFKLRPFYKKWIELETREGDEKSLAEVKKKALEYLTSLKEMLDE